MKIICGNMSFVRSLRLVFVAAIIIISSCHLSVAENSKEFRIDNKVRSFLHLVPIKRSVEFKIFASQLSKLKQNDFVFVDVRRPEEFEIVKIAGSLNITLHSIKTKQFLKSRNVVLVNNGANYFTLEQECSNLKEIGFDDVRILSGGIMAWKEVGGTVIGDLTAQEKINEIRPIEFFVDRNYDDWIVIDFSKNILPGKDPLFPAVIKTDTDEFIQKVNPRIEQNQINNSPYVLVINEDGLDYESVKQAINGGGLKNVYFLQGGRRGYQDFLQKQSLIWNPKTETTSTCATCPL